MADQGRDAGSEKPVRARLLAAAFAAFRDCGFAGTSTLEIATRAKVSKRELYAHFADKQAILTACFLERTKRMRAPLDLPVPQNREQLSAALTAFGTTILRFVCDPDVLAVYRLAIAETERSPAIARTLDNAGRQSNRAALVRLIKEAQARRLLRRGDATAMAEVFFASLWNDLLVRLLLRVTDAPTAKQADERAHAATQLLLQLYAAGQ